MGSCRVWQTARLGEGASGFWAEVATDKEKKERNDEEFEVTVGLVLNSNAKGDKSEYAMQLRRELEQGINFGAPVGKENTELGGQLLNAVKLN